jgi:hypothetical protein
VRPSETALVLNLKIIEILVTRFSASQPDFNPHNNQLYQQQRVGDRSNRGEMGGEASKG